jgi:hypothetical protein
LAKKRKPVAALKKGWHQRWHQLAKQSLEALMTQGI